MRLRDISLVSARFATLALAVAALGAVLSTPAAAKDRVRYGTAVVDGGQGSLAFYPYSTPFPVQPFSGRTVNQEYCGSNPEPCRQYSTSFQPYAPPVFYRIR